MKPQVYHVDTFTPIPSRGNSASVVLHADGLSDAQMQLIVRELYHSETVFLLISGGSDVHIRYLIPTAETPTRGHVIVVVHYVRARALDLGNCMIWQTSPVEHHRVDIDATGNDYRINLEQGESDFEPPLEDAVCTVILDALYLSEDNILAGLPIQVVATGHSRAVIPLKPEVDPDALPPDLPTLTAISQQIGCNDFFPFQIREGENATNGYMFSPAIGIMEDPATGNANGPTGVWLVHHGLMAHDGKMLCVQGHQGRAFGRDGVVGVMVTTRENQLEKVTIIGSAVILFHAEWAIDF